MAPLIYFFKVPGEIKVSLRVSTILWRKKKQVWHFGPPQEGWKSKFEGFGPPQRSRRPQRTPRRARPRGPPAQWCRLPPEGARGSIPDGRRPRPPKGGSPTPPAGPRPQAAAPAPSTQTWQITTRGVPSMRGSSVLPDRQHLSEQTTAWLPKEVTKFVAGQSASSKQFETQKNRGLSQCP